MRLLNLAAAMTLHMTAIYSSCAASLAFDFNNDGVLDVSDADAASDAIELDSVLQCIGISSGDFTGDGLVSFHDFFFTAAGYGGPASGFTSGDTNADGVVDFLDMMRVVDIFGTPGYAPPHLRQSWVRIRLQSASPWMSALTSC